MSAFKTCRKLENTYKVNGIIFYLKKIPLIKKLIPDGAYKSRAVKNVASVLSFLFEWIGKLFLYFLYFFVVLGVTNSALDDLKAVSFCHMFVFFSLAGALLTPVCSPSLSRYYTFSVLRMNARVCELSDFFVSTLKKTIIYAVFSVLIAVEKGLKIYTSVAIVCFAIGLIFISYAIKLYVIKKTKNYEMKKSKGEVILMLFSLLFLVSVALVFPLLKRFIFANELVLDVLAVIALLASIPCIKYILNYDCFIKIYKARITFETCIKSSDYSQTAHFENAKLITFEENTNSKKLGYKMLNELFMKRHRKFLFKPAQVLAVILAVVFAVLIGVVLIAKPAIDAEDRYQVLINVLPLILLFSYFINRGVSVTNVLFINCDSTMLTYSFYRKPKAILTLFTERLKSLILINALPTIVSAVMLPIVLRLLLGISFWLCALICVDILIMAIFFSVHTLAMYYLFQPFTVNLKAKSPIYSIITAATYIICYGLSQFKLPIVPFGLSLLAVTVLYISIILPLVYKIAPKTFKLRT